ncbi:hypothetical protein OKZ62_001877 [Vibrio navarrensis]|nr:hypothetical protein [Vibrio navarrensis]
MEIKLSASLSIAIGLMSGYIPMIIWLNVPFYVPVVCALTGAIVSYHFFRTEYFGNRHKKEVDVSNFIACLRKCGFGIGSWAYSSEELETEDCINQIAKSLSQANGIDEASAKEIANELVRHSHSFEQETLEKVNGNSKPHSLSELLKSLQAHN